MLNIVCVNSGTKYSNEYVNILCDGVARNLDSSIKFKFICFTNKPEGLDIDIDVMPLPENIDGWWNKLYLFKDGLFPEGDRIVYLDLKNVIVSSLDEIVAYGGKLTVLRDFMRPDGWQNSLMSWEANTLGYIWDKYLEVGSDGCWGDHIWMEKHCKECNFWQDLFPSAFVSYKVNNCSEGIPKGAKIVFFHGEPYPEHINNGWVPNVWKVGGGTSLEMVMECNTSRDEVISNIRHSLALGKSVFKGPLPSNNGHAVIIGGGPSINNCIDEIKYRQEKGQIIVALNNSWEWLKKKDISIHYHVMVDARDGNEDFIPPDESIHKLYATQCHPNVSRFADTLWNSLTLDIVPEFDNSGVEMSWIGCGSTIGIRSIYLMYAMGYREFHIYGFDSSYEGDNGHAYTQIINDGEKIIDVTVYDRNFRAAPWMVTQVHDFLETVECLTGLGCVFTIHGDGMLQHTAKHGLIQLAKAS